MTPGDRIAERLFEAGLSESEARSKSDLFSLAARALEDLAGAAPVESQRYFVPGRIEVLGKHTDYAGGRSLLGAVERGLCVHAAPRRDNRLQLVDAADGSRVELILDDSVDSAVSGWAIYPATVARRIARNFPAARRGADVAFASDLPRAAGLSSSSALVAAICIALGDLNGLAEHREFSSSISDRRGLADYLAGVENGAPFGALSGDRGAGAWIGSEDPTAILCCRAGELSQDAFCPTRHERSVCCGEDRTFVIASSGVPSDKTGSVMEGYNRLSGAARALLDIWRRATGRGDATLLAAATSAPDACERMRGILARSSHSDFSAGALRDRFDQFVFESVAIVPAAADALDRSDDAAFGALADRSQELAERLLQNQTRETRELARSARALGAVAASAFGGGFGGSVWALVATEASAEFQHRWAGGYVRAFPDRSRASEFFPTRPGPGLTRIDRDRIPGAISDLI